MKRIVITGIQGGVGATTVAANLTIALHSIEQKAHAIDMNPTNFMRLHFSMDPNNNDGWMLRRYHQEPWQQAGYQNHHQIPFVPFGELTEAQYQQQLTALQQQPMTLLNNISPENKEAASKSDWQIILLPEITSLQNFHYPLLDAADLVICVIRPDIQSYLSLQKNRHYQALHEKHNIKLLMNVFNANSEVSRDLQLVIKHEYKEMIIPTLMHFDTAVPEAVANLTSVLEAAPYSQAAQDYRSFAFWCLAHVNQEIMVTPDV